MMAGRVDFNTARTSPRRTLGQKQQPQHLNGAPEPPEPRPEAPDKQRFVTARAEPKNGIDLNKYAELLREQMAPLKFKDAEESGDREALIAAIRELQDYEHLKDDFNSAVSRLNQINEFREELLQACDQQNRKAITELLRYGTKTGVSKFCRFEVKQAEKLAEELGVRALPLPVISSISRQTMTELRSYSKPSPLVHRIMQAVFLLFGEDEERTSVWTYCQVLCKPDGPNGFIRKIMTFRLDDVDPFILNRVGELIRNIELREILKASPAAAIFYVWLRSLVNQQGTDDQSVSEKSSMASMTTTPVTSRQRQTKASDDTTKRAKIIEKEKEIFGQLRRT